MSETLKCPNCGATIHYKPGDNPVALCKYCYSTVVIPEELRQAASSFVTAGSPDPAAQTRPSWPPDLLRPEKVAKIQQLSQLLHGGGKIEAIKLYQETFGVGLKEASDAVDKLVTEETFASISVGVNNVLGNKDPEQVKARIRELLQSGEKIEAIKYYRQISGQGLKESKDAIDDFEITGDLTIPPAWHGDGEKAQAEADLMRVYQMISIVELVQAGDRLGAINAYQEAFEASFAEAQEVVHKISMGVTEDSPSVIIDNRDYPVQVKQAAKLTAGFLGGISCLAVAGILFTTLLIVVPVLFGLASPGGPLEGTWNRINPLAYARVALAFGEQGSGAGLFDDPRGVAVDSQGNVFVADYSDGRVQKFDSAGDYQSQWNIGAEKYVSGMAADNSGEVLLVYRGDIWKFNGETGEPTGKLGDEQDLWFESLAATTDGGLVAAANSQQIYRFDKTGSLVFSLADVPGAQTSEAEGVGDIAVDGVGGLYLLTDEDSVLVYSPQGRLVARFGSSGDEPGQFRAPSAIAVDGQGNIYVSDITGIQVFANDGRYKDKIEVEGYAFDLAFDSQGNLWVVSNLPKVFMYRIVK